MKKILSLLTAIISCAIISPVLATSGACSYHYGVNCSAGSDYDGSVICNDGNRDSSVLFSSMVECRTPIYTSPCIPPTETDCDVNTLTATNARNGLLGSSFGNANMTQCQAKHDAYIQKQGEYDRCNENLFSSLLNPIPTISTPVVDTDTICKTQYGSAAKVSPSRPGYCVCYDNYRFNEQGTQCISNDSYCVNKLGLGAYFDIGSKICDCGAGYVSSDGLCVAQNLYCQNTLGSSAYYNANTKSCQVPVSPLSTTPSATPDSASITTINVTSALLESHQTSERAAEQTTVNAIIIKRLLGRILLQVEEHGEAWYLNPTTKKRYYMKDGAAAYQMLRTFGVGVTSSDLQKVQRGNKMLINKLKGQVLLQVQSHGEAYYIHPVTGTAYYMKDGDAAYLLMKKLGTGVTNTDLLQIPIGETTNNN